MLAFTQISPDTTTFPWAKRTPIRALELTLAVGLCLVLGRWFGHPAAGSIAAGAAFTIGYAAFHEAMTSSLLSMALLTAGIASATLAGSLAAHSTPWTLALCVLSAVIYGLLMGVSPTSGWLGQQCSVFVIVSGGFTQGHRYAVGRAAMVVLGGVIQMVIYGALALWTKQRKPAEVHLRQLRTRSRQLWTVLRDELRWSAGTTGYTLRLAVVLLLTTLLYRERHLGNGYWAPMTALLVLKPEWTSTLSRGVARLLGTLGGAVLALGFAHWHGDLQLFAIFVAVLVFAWGCFALQAVNYAAFSFCLTLYTVFSFRLGGFSQPAAAHLRLLNTAIGGGLALAVDAIWMMFSRGHSREKAAPETSPARPPL